MTDDSLSAAELAAITGRTTLRQQLAGQGASALLQHSSEAVTRRHYAPTAKLKPVR